MNDWKAIFGSYVNDGVYLAAPGAKLAGIKKTAKAAGYEVISINLNRAKTSKDFLTAVARGLKFPAYFGENWDALNDSLMDMSWYPARGYAIILTGYGAFRGKMGAEDLPIEHIFESAAAYWQQKAVPFFIIVLD